MRIAMRIVFIPIMLIARLALGIAAFIVSISTALLDVVMSVFAFMAVLEFIIGQNNNAIALLILAILASPAGLPLIANWLLERLDAVFGFIEERI